MFGMVKVRGRFRDFDGTILYDPAHPERSSVTAVIKTESIDTDMSLRDTHLKSPDFFDAASFPAIVFQSERVTKRGRGFVAVGPLTMHGVTRQITLPIAVVLAPHTTPASGQASVAFEGSIRI